MSQIDIQIGRQIVVLRELRGLSRGALSATARIPVDALENYERGATRIGAQALFEIAAILSVGLSYFYANITIGDEHKNHRARRMPSRKRGGHIEFSHFKSQINILKNPEA
jgi:transcriptional regulator with XRE-family HTH domain